MAEKNSRRMSRLLAKDGRSLMLALDAWNFKAPAGPVDAAVNQVPNMVGNGLDAVLVTYGIAQNAAPLLRDTAVVLRCDGTTDPFDPSVPETRILNSALDAVRVGADGIVVMAFPGAAHGAAVQDAIQDLQEDAKIYNLPMIVETLPYSYAGTGERDSLPEVVAGAVRFAEELGADLVKTRMTGTDADRQIIDQCHVPVVALGGPKTDTLGYLEYVARVLDYGACGIAVGRNVVEDPNPLAKIKSLGALIHDGVSPTDAMKIYQEG